MAAKLQHKSSDDSHVVRPIEVRWDRHLRRAMDAKPRDVNSGFDAGPTIAAGGSDGHEGTNMLRGAGSMKARLVRWAKAPLQRLRSFLVAPLLQKVDLLEQHLIGDGQSGLSASHQATSAALAALQKDVLALHAKTDEIIFASRPTIKRDDAYAVPLADGYIFIPQEEEQLLLMYAGAGAYGIEPGARRILKSVVEPGGRAIDVGANLGLHTLALGRAVGSSGRVDAFEPEPRLERPLRKTLEVNGMGNVTLHTVAAGAQAGEATFHVAATIGHSSLYDLDQGGTREELTVSVTPLDAVIAEDARIDVIKIDVEGAEIDVLVGAKRIIGSSPGIAIVAECGPSHLARTNVTLEGWFAAFEDHGFDAYAIIEPFGTLRRFDLQWVSNQHTANVLFLRPGSRAERKLLFDLELLERARTP